MTWLGGLGARSFRGVSAPLRAKALIKDHGTKGTPYTVQLDEAEMHLVAFSADTTLTIASTRATDKGTISIKNGGNAITLAGIDSGAPILTNAASTKDILGIEKSFGTIVAVSSTLNVGTT